jgi:hypothetical protein
LTIQQNQLHHISPYERFYLALKSSESKRQYPKRLQKFLDFLEIEGSTIDEKCLNCYNLIKGKTNEEIEDLIFKFIIFQNKRIDNKEIGPGGFQLTVVPNNPFIGSPDSPLNVEEPTTTTSVSDGYWILLPTLPPGAHTITFGGVANFPEADPDVSFRTEVTYNLVVSGSRG